MVVSLLVDKFRRPPKGERALTDVAVAAADGLFDVTHGLPCIVVMVLVLSARGGVKKRPVTA